MKKKKGFTLVELLVVIAILAVLATVSVVGYMGFTKKAKESNDASLTTQMNTALQANGVVKKNKTLTEAREDLLEAGIDLEKVTPTTDGYSYVWDSKQDLMFLLNENRDVVAPTNATISANTVDSFVVVHNEAEFNTWKSDYSLYFANGYESKQLILEKLVGIDAGTSGINNISVKDDSSTADVTMYTTSGTLTIDARQATVRHYGEAKNVSIIAIAGKSYHEYGTVTGNVEVEDGHVVVENTANVSTIVAKPTNNSTVKVTATNENNVGTIVTTDTSKTTFNVPESVKPTENVTSDKLTEMNDFAGGFGTERSPYLIENGNQFSNINKIYSSVKNIDSFQNLSKYNGKAYYFKQINNINVDSAINENYVIRVFTGEYDGNGFKLKLNKHVNPEARYSLIQTVFGKFIIKNMDIVFDDGAAYTLISINDFTTNNGKLDAELNNITVSSDKTVSFSSGIYGIFWSNYAKNFKSIKFINCVNYANVSNGGTTTGVFTGSGWSLSKNDYGDTAKDVKVQFINCFNYGNIVGKNQVGVIYGHRNYVVNEIENDCYSFVELNNVANYGKIKATDKDGCARFAPVFDKDIAKDRFAEYTTKYQSLYSVGDNVFEIENLDLQVNLLTNEISTNVDASSFKVSYVISSMYYDGVPSNTTEFVYDLTKSNNVSSTKYTIIAKNSTEKYEYDSYGIYFNNTSGTLELIFEKKDGRTFGENDTYSSVSVFIKAYDSTGMLIGTSKFN